MRRVISLFAEPDEAYAPSLAQEEVAPLQSAGFKEPLYFVQLLEYLRQRREAIEARGREMAAAEQN